MKLETLFYEILTQFWMSGPKLKTSRQQVPFNSIKSFFKSTKIAIHVHTMAYTSVYVVMSEIKPMLFCSAYQEVFGHTPTILGLFVRFPEISIDSRRLPMTRCPETTSDVQRLPMLFKENSENFDYIFFVMFTYLSHVKDAGKGRIFFRREKSLQFTLYHSLSIKTGYYLLESYLSKNF